ncbi:4-(cytidine 5'-diphospho)-2-C-methyl-D-erythritol kinase [uncultured Corynebacterium sp.]|uniref:4-(cytidine 5'-diphospho)-2-C-methyl-D-erythritol kinase n=1 Tax=uncultured Corynebacterium sp. TaxID=159447 RepID=UPI00263438B6|nr:4-(cytidine 5'-diphospho)-2-C-methyl-D-erythritol kinase [uncultured Corynebacterium sp.]
MKFTARANGKVNLHLGVGEVRGDGYHDLSTVFMAVDRPETVTLSTLEGETSSSTAVKEMHTTYHVQEPDEDLDNPKNLAWKAVDLICREYAGDLPPLRLDVDKTVPVAGGMAGGSADAAAAVEAISALIAHVDQPLAEEIFGRVLPSLGADVPFAQMGGIALGTERGDSLVPMMGRGKYWFAFLNPKVGLSTKSVFEKLDDLRFNYASMVPHMDTTTLSRALLSGDPQLVGAAMHNDLEAAAIALRPSLQQLIHDAEDAGAIRAMISGSGPTVAALCADEETARGVVDKLAARGDIEAFAAHGPVGGVELL